MIYLFNFDNLKNNFKLKISLFIIKFFFNIHLKLGLMIFLTIHFIYLFPLYLSNTVCLQNLKKNFPEVDFISKMVKHLMLRSRSALTNITFLVDAFCCNCRHISIIFSSALIVSPYTTSIVLNLYF